MSEELRHSYEYFKILTGTQNLFRRYQVSAASLLPLRDKEKV
jgi:hypothetical protein